MYTLINIQYPLRSAITFYIILFLIIKIMRPNLLDNKNKYKSLIIVVIVSVISYYIFTMLNSILIK